NSPSPRENRRIAIRPQSSTAHGKATPLSSPPLIGETRDDAPEYVQPPTQGQPANRVVGMGLLDQLWDETVAGPQPESGLGRLRRYSSFSPSLLSPATPAAAEATAPAMRRSSTMAGPPSLSVDQSPRGESYSSSVPSSPASAPDSPFAADTTPKADSWSRLRRNPKASEPVRPRSPTVYDWVVISSLDQ
ncbi:unnamed protein product, partial [Urochloa humidicola]